MGKKKKKNPFSSPSSSLPPPKSATLPTGSSQSCSSAPPERNQLLSDRSIHCSPVCSPLSASSVSVPPVSAASVKVPSDSFPCVPESTVVHVASSAPAVSVPAVEVPLGLKPATVLGSSSQADSSPAAQNMVRVIPVSGLLSTPQVTSCAQGNSPSYANVWTGSNLKPQCVSIVDQNPKINLPAPSYATGANIGLVSTCVAPEGIAAPSPMGTKTGPSWLDILKGSSEQSRRKLASFLLESGEKCVRIPKAVVHRNLHRWSSFILGQFHGDLPSHGALHGILNGIWSNKLRDITVSKAGPRQVLIRIPDSSTRERVLSQGMWTICGQTMFVAKWSPNLSIALPELKEVPVWLELRGVPLHFFSEEALFPIVDLVGKPIRLHPSTENLTNLEVVKVLTVIDPTKQLTPIVYAQLDEGEICPIAVSCPWLPPICAFCQKLGHSQRLCPEAPILCTLCQSKTHSLDTCRNSPKTAVLPRGNRPSTRPVYAYVAKHPVDKVKNMSDGVVDIPSTSPIEAQVFEPTKHVESIVQPLVVQNLEPIVANITPEVTPTVKDVLPEQGKSSDSTSRILLSDFDSGIRRVSSTGNLDTRFPPMDNATEESTLQIDIDLSVKIRLDDDFTSHPLLQNRETLPPHATSISIPVKKTTVKLSTICFHDYKTPVDFISQS